MFDKSDIMHAFNIIISKQYSHDYIPLLSSEIMMTLCLANYCPAFGIKLVKMIEVIFLLPIAAINVLFCD